LELRHLRYFVATAEAGTVTAAAERLHLTQPALSRQLRQLQRELGVDLFEPVGRRLELTGVGQAVLPHAKDVLSRADTLAIAAAFHAHGRLERLTIGAPTVTLTDVVAPFIATLAPDDPTTGVLGADGLSPVETLHRGADLAIGTARATPPFRSEPLAVLPVWAYVPPSHPWRDRSRVSLLELLTRTLIVLPPSFTARQSLDGALAEADADYATTPIEAANGTVAQALAAAGRGIAVASDDPRFGLVPLAVDLHAPARPGAAEGQNGRPLSIRLIALWDSRHPAAATIEQFARRLGGFVRARYDAPAT